MTSPATIYVFTLAMRAAQSPDEQLSLLQAGCELLPDEFGKICTALADHMAGQKHLEL